jgi:hypothetical protein
MIRKWALTLCLFLVYLQSVTAQSVFYGRDVPDSAFVGVLAENAIDFMRSRGYSVKQLFSMEAVFSELHANHRIALATLDYAIGSNKAGYFMVVQKMKLWPSGRFEVKLLDQEKRRAVFIKKYDPDHHFWFSIYL